MAPENPTPTEVSYTHEDVEIRSFVTRPPGDGPFPAILTLHGIYGLNPPDLNLTERLASRGYLALAHGWQSREHDPADRLVMEDIRSGIRYLKESEPVDPDRIGLVGFCRGGTLAMLAAGEIGELSAAVVFYGQAVYGEKDEKKPVSAIEEVEKIRAPILVFHGGKDTAYPIEDAYRYRDRLQEAGKTHEFRDFPEAGHAYFFEGAPNYDAQASTTSWEMMTAFFDRRLAPA